MGGLIIVNNKQLETKEYKGRRVVTSWDIAKVHGREVKKINQQFERNKDKLVKEKDYFLMSREEFSGSLKVTQKFIPNNVKEIPLFTESGYLMLNKTFNDDLSWEIQRQLIDNYFKTKALKVQTTMKEALQIAIDLENENRELHAKIKHDEPKLDYLSDVLESEGTLLATQIAADYGLSAIDLNRKLHEEGLIRRVGSQWVLYKKHMNKDYADSETTLYFDRKTGEEKLKVETKWTEKGRLKIHEILAGLGIEAKVVRSE